jgi:hypothetical protein
MEDQTRHWRTKQVAPPPNDWVAIFVTDDGIEVRDVAAVLVQEYVWAKDSPQTEPARAALAIATFDGMLIPARDQDGFAGAMARADYDEAAAAAKGLAS